MEAPGGEGGRRPEISKKITNFWEGKDGRDQGGHVGGGKRDLKWLTMLGEREWISLISLIGEVEDFMGDWAE